MKRIIALLLAVTMILTGCSKPQTQTPSTNPSNDSTTEVLSVPAEWIEVQPEFDSLSDENLLLQVENLVYRETVQALNSEEYVVENVSAVYISKEYLEEVAFNSQSNVYFGYTLAELDEVFQGPRYIFTLGDDGNTTVRELQAIDDNATETMLKNVAIGTGVILVCVTVSVVSAGVGDYVQPCFAAFEQSLRLLDSHFPDGLEDRLARSRAKPVFGIAARTSKCAGDVGRRDPVACLAPNQVQCRRALLVGAEKSQGRTAPLQFGVGIG